MNTIAKRILMATVFVVFLAHNSQTSNVSQAVGWPDPQPCYNDKGEEIGLCVKSKMECILNHGDPIKGGCGIFFFLECCIYYRYECNVEMFGDEMYISSPGYPTPTIKNGNCIVRLENWNPFNNRQIRLDFIDFDMAMPSKKETAVCDTDMLVISSGDDRSKDLKICGPYAQQHLYYRADELGEVINMKFITGSSNRKKSWKVKVTRVDTEMEAPVNCTQFHQGYSGILQLANVTQNGIFMKNKTFKMCLKRAKNVCWVKYGPCALNDTRFELMQSVKEGINMPYIELGLGVITDILDYGQTGCVRYDQQYCP